MAEDTADAGGRGGSGGKKEGSSSKAVLDGKLVKGRLLYVRRGLPGCLRWVPRAPGEGTLCPVLAYLHVRSSQVRSCLKPVAAVQWKCVEYVRYRSFTPQTSETAHGTSRDVVCCDVQVVSAFRVCYSMSLEDLDRAGPCSPVSLPFTFLEGLVDLAWTDGRDNSQCDKQQESGCRHVSREAAGEGRKGSPAVSHRQGHDPRPRLRG